MRRRADLKLFHLEDLDVEEEKKEKKSSDKDVRKLLAETVSPAPPNGAASTARDLLVTIKDASGLMAADITGLSDPLCICEIPGRIATKYETSIVRRTLAPVWNETTKIRGFDQGESLLFTVMDWDLDKREFLGKASLSYAQIGALGLEAELELQVPKAPKGSCGKLRVQVDVLDPVGLPVTPSRRRWSVIQSLSTVFARTAGRRASMHDTGRSTAELLAAELERGPAGLHHSALERVRPPSASGGRQQVAPSRSQGQRRSTWEGGPIHSSHEAPQLPAEPRPSRAGPTHLRRAAPALA